MGRYILRRALLLPPTLFGDMVINFTVVQFAPGGPVEPAIGRGRIIASARGPSVEFKHQVRMLTHLIQHVVPQRYKKQLCALAPRELHRRYEVAVAGYQNDDLNLPFQRQRRDVEPNAYIDALLLDVGQEVLGSDRHFWRVKRHSTPTQRPTAKSQLSHAQSNERDAPQLSYASTGCKRWLFRASEVSEKDTLPPESGFRSVDLSGGAS